MKHAIRSALVAFIFGVTGMSAAHAGVITVGTKSPGGENSLPLGGAIPNARYQQVYGSSAFGAIDEPIYINSLSFFANPLVCSPLGCWNQTQSISQGNYVVRLSTTSRAVGGLSTGSLNANLGADVAVFFSGILKDTLTIHGNAFRYDRTMGNLLMDIMVTGQVANNTYFDVSAALDDQMSRMYSSNGGNVPTTTGSVNARSIGLVTEFGYTRVSDIPAQVPEPASMALMGAGLGLLGFMRRRKTV